MSETLTVVWNPLLIMLAFAVSFVGAYTGINLFEQYRLLEFGNEQGHRHTNKFILILLMAISFGAITIWSMCFVSMTSVKLRRHETEEFLTIQYRLDFLLISLFSVTSTCFLGLFISSFDKAFTKDRVDAVHEYINHTKSLSFQEIRRSGKYDLIVKTLSQSLAPLLMAGFFLGSGVLIMHYICMWGVAFDGHTVWNEGVVSAAVIIALLVASAAFWILFRVLILFPRLEYLRILSAMIMMIAVNGTHYTGLSSATYTYDEGHVDRGFKNVTLVSQQDTLFGVLFAVVMFVSFVLLFNAASIRSWYYDVALIIREADSRMTFHLENPLTANEVFLSEYSSMRQESKNRQKAILELRLKSSKVVAIFDDHFAASEGEV